MIDILCIVVFLLALLKQTGGYRIYDTTTNAPNGSYFKPYDRGFVGTYGLASNLGRERINEGSWETPEQELIFEGPSPRQTCPGMIGPFVDGNYYCTAREYGYCDRRSGTCFCNIGYQDLDCSQCQGSHLKVGNLCYPKKLCPNDCSGAGDCNFATGTCTCLPHRVGVDCSTLLCSTFHPLCESCTPDGCLRCLTGFYLSGNSSDACRTCYDFDPRCSACTKEAKCTNCADPLLTSVRRSGYRKSDARLPLEEDNREFSITIPFGSKSPEAFADSENFFVIEPKKEGRPLSNYSQRCVQGERFDASWNCYPYPASHVICAHYGVFTFTYPNYRVSEITEFIELTVERTGGGYEAIDINYYIRHITTNESDVSPTAYYTTTQKLTFDYGVVKKTFKITIFDDNLVEEDEVFQVVLETPVRGSVGAQFRTNVTIVDDDINKFSTKMSKLTLDKVTAKAGVTFSIGVNAAIANRGARMTTGGEKIFGIIENYANRWEKPGTPSNAQRHTNRQVLTTVDNGDGTYKVISNTGIKEQGKYDLHVFHGFPGGLKAQYFSDSFFEKLALERIDRQVNFTWGTGRMLNRVSDYMSIRWHGGIMPTVSGMYYFKMHADDNSRLWIDGKLLLDHWHELAANLEPVRSIYMQAGKLYEITLEYREVRGEAFAYLLWGLDQYKMEILKSNFLYTLYEVDRSPALISIESGSSYAPYTECTGDGLFKGEALKTSYFSFCPRDQFRNLRNDDNYIYLVTELFRAELRLLDDMKYNGEGSEYIEPQLIYNNATSCYDGHYIPIRAGLYRLDITLQSWRFEPQIPVAGSPFFLEVVPTRTFGPYSRVDSEPKFMDAGTCDDFKIVSRDAAQNLRLTGGDKYTVYMYQIDYNRDVGGSELPLIDGAPTLLPTKFPTFAPSVYNYANSETTGYRLSPPIETDTEVVRFGTVTDHGDGNYTARVCPVISGWYEIHILLNTDGISNQPFRLMDKIHSQADAMGRQSYSGQFVHNSPYTLTVSHSIANALSCTARGPGLNAATVGIPTTFMVTVRDAWDNVLRTSNHHPTVQAVIDRTPNAIVNIWEYKNGSYNVEYIANISGWNLITVNVNGNQIIGSPFKIYFDDGQTSERYSYAVGPGLLTGTAGEVSYFQVYAFDIDNNRKTHSDDRFSFTYRGSNNGTGLMLPCPKPYPVEGHPICDPYDSMKGHYWGSFVPTVSRSTVIRIYLRNIVTNADDEIENSPFKPVILPTKPVATYTDIIGHMYMGPFGNFTERLGAVSTLYDNEAGVTGYIDFHLRDRFHNRLWHGGYKLELVLLGVGVEWGSIEPWNATPGLMNYHHYKGFYGGYPDVYGNIIDHEDGSYTASFNAPKAGMYIMRLAMAEHGLNATYFNNTDFGYLVDANYNDPTWKSTKEGLDVNTGDSISWTGDLGRRPGQLGDIGNGSFYYRFRSTTQENIDFKLGIDVGYSPFNKLGHTPGTFNFRQEYWSVRYVGMVTPLFAETYTFHIKTNEYSDVRLWIGGIGSAFNQSKSSKGDLVISYDYKKDSSGTINKLRYLGSYKFTDVKYREIVLEYAHYTGMAELSLLWESPSTPLQVVPPSSFFHWNNVSHFNTTIHPTDLDPHSSTAYSQGNNLHEAVVGKVQSFVVYGRDRFGNLLQYGNDAVSMVAVGSEGVMFRGDVVDYGNSTYLVSYYPTVAGRFRMYVTIGCCPPHPNVGIAAEVEMFEPLLVRGAPFDLTVVPAKLDVSTTIAVGQGLTGGVCGNFYSFTVLFRDLHNNPTTITGKDGDNLHLDLTVTHNVTGNWIKMPLDDYYYIKHDGNITVFYNLSKSGPYQFAVTLSFANHTDYHHIMGSPFPLVFANNKPDPLLTISRGIGLRDASTGSLARYELQLVDIYKNYMNYGGYKFYMRLIGSAAYHSKNPVIPNYFDLKNGKYQCQYTPIRPGPHHLHVMLLNSSRNFAGGTGLTAYYYTSHDFNTQSSPWVTEIVPNIALEWPSSRVIPNFKYATNMSTISVLPQMVQSIVYEGYLVSPRNDTFTITARSVLIDVAIFLEGDHIFDSQYHISAPVTLQENEAYKIRIEAKIVPYDDKRPVSVHLMWSSTDVRESLIPKFYLYDSAVDINQSPFPVKVV